MAEPLSAKVHRASDFSEATLGFRCTCGRNWHETWPMPMLALALSKRLSRLTCPDCNKYETIFFCVEGAETS